MVEGRSPGVLCMSARNLLSFPTLRVLCFDALSQAGNVVTGEMVEELILSGADIIKVGIGPGERLHWGPRATSPVANACGAQHCSHYTLLRLCVHHPEENWSGVPTAQCSDGVCRCCPWPQRPHHLGKAQGQGIRLPDICVFCGVWRLW